MPQPTIQAGSIASYVGFYSTSFTTRTISVTVGSGTNRTLFVACAFQQGSSANVPPGFGITYDGTALTLVGTYGVGATGAAVLYKLDDPPVGTANLVAGNASVSVLTSFTMVSFVADGLNGSGRLSSLSTSSAIGLSTPKTTTIAATADDVSVYLVASPKSDIAALSGQTPFIATGLIGIDTWYCNFSYKPGASSSVGVEWASGGTTQIADAAVVLYGVAGASVTGTITLDAFTLSGDLSTGALSQLSGGITLDNFALSGFLGLAPGRIDSNPFKNWSGTLLPGVTIPRLTFLRLSDMSTVLQLTNQVTAGDGVLTVTNAAFTPGTTYLVVAASVDGASLGAEIYTAT